MIELFHLTGDKWLTLLEYTPRHMRRFVGTRDECEAVKAEWMAGNFKRGTEDKRE